MSNSADVAQLYKNVIEEVIKNMRNDFVNMGVDEQVLVDLQAMWEQKLIEARVFNAADFPVTAMREYGQGTGFFYPSAGNVRAPLGVVPALGMGINYGSAVAAMPMAPALASRPYAVYYAPPRPVMGLGGGGGVGGIGVATATSNTHLNGGRDGALEKDGSLGRNDAIPSSSAATFIAQHPSDTIPQVDGMAEDQSDGDETNLVESNSLLDRGRPIEIQLELTMPMGKRKRIEVEQGNGRQREDDAPGDNGGSIEEIPQLDGTDHRYDGEEKEGKNRNTEGEGKDRNTEGEGKDRDTEERQAKRSRTSVESNSLTSLHTIASNASTADADDDQLGSDLDDEAENGNDMDDEKIEDMILCQYEKISRVRTRWRGVLRAGIIHANHSDYCFSRSNIDFDW